jgi:replicative DNA helicase
MTFDVMKAEQAVLGACLMAPETALPAALEILSADDFLVQMHRDAFEMMRGMLNAAHAIDITTFFSRAMDAGKIREDEVHVGSTWIGACAAPMHVREYARIVKSKSRQRAFLAAIDEASKKVMEGLETEEDFRGVVENAMASMERIQAESTHSTKGQRDAVDVMIDVAETFGRRYSHRGQPMGLATGFEDIDRNVNGFQPQDFVVIGARPSMGKTSFGATFCEHVALDACNRANVPVLMVTLEMSDEQIMERVILGRSGIKYSKGRTGMFSDVEGAIWRAAPEALRATRGKSAEAIAVAITAAAADALEAKWTKAGRFAPDAKNPVTNHELQDATRNLSAYGQKIAAVATGKLSFYDSYGATCQELRMEIGKWIRRIGWSGDGSCLTPPMVMIDYLQLIKPSSKAGKKEKRFAIEEACEMLKGLAKRYNIVVCALAQIGRSNADNPGQRPAMKDFKESGAIEEFADCLMSIHRPCFYKKWDTLSDDVRGKWEERAKFRNKEEAARTLKEPEWEGQTYYEAQADIEILKGRNVATVVHQVIFHGKAMRFASKTPSLYSNNPDRRQRYETEPTESTEPELTEGDLEF